jgi:uncharacterized protein DUF5715
MRAPLLPRKLHAQPSLTVSTVATNSLMKRSRQILIVLFISAVAAFAVWVALRWSAPRFWGQPATADSDLPVNTDPDLWTRGVEKVKEDRGEPTGVALEVPSQLKHYSDRRWFLATQVAAVRKSNVRTCQDYVDLASLIENGDLVPVPAATANYILFGVGAKADEDVFSRYQDDQSIGLYSESQLADEYRRQDNARANLESEINERSKQSASLKKSERAKQRELQKEISARQQQLKTLDEDRAKFDQLYGTPESRQILFAEYASLQKLAKDFGGRSYDLTNAADRQALKLNMLRSLRPQALKVMEELAANYHQQFDRPLPVSSLVRPEEYQHALRKVNRNAVLIDTPPHSTGLAFDIDYRYMSAAEQNSIMADLARLEEAGRIEVIRESAANYHVFVFIDGARPPDELIAAALEDAGPAPKEANHVTKKPAKPHAKKASKSRRATAKPRRRHR